MSGPNPNPSPAAAAPGGWSPATIVLALVVVLVVVIVVWNVASGNPKMSDGSDPTAPDPDLKAINSGVQYRDLKPGVGDVCPEGAKAVVHYTGWLEDGTVFDSSRGGTKAFEADLLTGVIPGWREGVPGMKKGGVRKLVIAPEKAYGAKGFGAKIPPNATLIFEIELVRFTEPAEPVIKSRPRRSPLPTDLTKLSDGTLPTDDDKGLVPLGTGGLLIRDLKVGDGEECRHGATVVMDYIGWRKADGVLFDSSFKQANAFTSPLGSLIRGWVDGVPGMKVGGIRKLVIPAALGYGDRGSPPKIPGGATLVFEIELLGTK